MKLPTKQRGATGIAWLFLIVVILFVVLTIIKVMPVYIDQFNVSSVLGSMKNEPGISTMEPGQVTSRIMKRLDINMVKNIRAEDIYISQKNNTRMIEIEYQVQQKLVANIDLLFHFNNSIEVPLR